MDAFILPFLIASLLKPIDSSFITITPVSVGGSCKITASDSLYTHEHIRNTKKNLVKEPLYFLQRNAQLSSLRSSITCAKAHMLHVLDTVVPGWMFDECTSDGCLFNRLSSSVRTKFEQQIFTYVQQSKPDISVPLVYTSFGSGDLMADILLLDRILSAGYQHITIHLIDTRWNSFINNVYAKNPCTSEDQARYVHTLLQLMHWHAAYIPTSDIQCFIHSNAKSYIEYCQTHEHARPDIYVGSDYYQDNIESAYDFFSIAYTCAKPETLCCSLADLCGVSNWQSEYIAYIFSKRENIQIDTRQDYLDQDNLDAYFNVLWTMPYA
jgi:hypothetical protein